MNYTAIIPMIKNQVTLFISVLLFTSYVAYEYGVDSVKVEVLCKNQIQGLDQCHIDLKEQQKQCASELTLCHTQCQLDKCKPMCTKQVSDAIESYKKLNQEFCGGDK